MKDKAREAFLKHYYDSDYNDNVIIALLVGGSTLYGLNNENSDIDIRGIFSLSKPSQILGLDLYKAKSFDSYTINNDEVDGSLHELRHYIYLLSKTNTQVLDVLFAPEDAFFFKDIYIDLMRENASRLIDSGQLYNSMKGYIHNEIRLLLGERTGKLGGKRKDALDTYGYSYKNLVQVLRLSFAAKTFFQTGEYPVKISDFDQNLHDELMDIKNNPSKFSYEYAQKRSENLISDLERHYAQREVDVVFDYDFANSIIATFYGLRGSAIKY
jgi:predicted nucleotidyltransferase